MRVTLLLCFFFYAVPLLGQQGDFENASFKIKAVAMQVESPRRLLISLPKDAPSRFILTDVRSPSFNKTTASLVYKKLLSSSSQKIPSINYKATSHPEPALKVWGNSEFQNDNTGSVPNIAYKPAFFGTYCTALYAPRSGN